MAKAKKRVAARKKAPKRGKASAKPARKKAAKRAAPKKHPAKKAAKMAPRKARRVTAPRKPKPVIEDTIIDVIDEPVPGVVRVTEYETITTTTPAGDGGAEEE